MNRSMSKKLSILLAVVMVITSFFSFSAPVFAYENPGEEGVYIETFDNLDNTSQSYIDGSFTGNYGIEWHYQGGRGSLGSYEIDGKGLMLGGIRDDSRIYAEDIPGGIQEFAVDLKKGFTNNNARAVELFINDESYGVFDLDLEDTGVQVFSVEDIDVEGDFTLELRHASGESDRAQIVVDNIRWASMEEPDNGDDPGDGDDDDLEVMPVEEVREAELGTEVVAEGIVTTKPGSFGGQGFYIQDETGGIYSFTGNEDMVSVVDRGKTVRIFGERGEFRGQSQISIDALEVVDENTVEPDPKSIEVEGIEDGEHDGVLVALSEVEVLELIRESYDTATIKVTDGANDGTLRLDNRTGDDYDDVAAMLQEEDIIDVTGVVQHNEFGERIMLRGVEDIYLEEAPPEGVLTVQEAIDNNEGEGTVEGYIVGTVISGGNYQLEPPFTSDTNLAMADDPEETDPDKILPVQLPAGSIRSELNLEDNPDNYHRKVQITGDLEDYFGVPGLRSPSEYQWADSEDEEDPEEPIEGVLSPLEAKKIPMEVEVTVTGTVTHVFSAREAYIQDDMGGLQVNLPGIGDVIQSGDEVEITGELGIFRGELQFVPGDLEESIEILSQDNELPEAKEVSLKSVAQTNNYMNVSEVLAQYEDNEETVTVKGVITETLPNNEFAMEIRDLHDDGETINVALPAGYRDDFNPELNPDAVGRVVLVTGQQDNYFGEPAIRQTSDWDPVNEVSTAGEFHVGFDVEGMLVETMYPGEVRGTDNHGFTLRDEEDSAYVYSGRAKNFDLDSIEEGDWYFVEGIVGFYDRAQLKLMDGEDLRLTAGPGQQDPTLPLVLNPKPAPFTTVYDNTPLISVDLEASEVQGAGDILYDEIKMYLNGEEVDANVDQENDHVSYQVPEDLAIGDQDVEVHVPDSNGGVNEFAWFFTVQIPDTDFNFFYGIPHAHTAYSDGAGDPTQAFNHARDRGVDFLAITDHSNWLDGVTDGNFEYDQSRDEYVERNHPETGEPSEWLSTRLEAEAFNSENEDFLALRGFEQTSSIWGHANTINSSTYVEAKSQMVPLRDYYEWAADVSTRPGENVFNMFNHPNWPDDSFADLAYVPDMDRYFNGIEVANGAPPYSYTRSEGHYWKALDNGWRVGAMNAQDNHAENWGDPDTLTAVIAEDLTTDSVVDAMNERRMYSTETRTLELTFKGNDHWMGSVIDVDPGEDIDFEILAEDSEVDIQKIQLITNGGTIIDEMTFDGGTDSAQWSPSVEAAGGAEWFVVKVIHDMGLWGTSSPIFTAGGEYDLKLTALNVDPDPTLPGFETELTATVANMGIRHVDEEVEVSFYLNDPEDEDMLIGKDTYSDRMTSGSNVELSTEWTPDPDIEPGRHRIYAVLTDIDGVTTVTEISSGVTVVNPIGKRIMIDNSHNNTDVPGTVLEMIEMLRLYGYEAVLNEEPITEELLEDFDVMIINVPDSENDNFTDSETEAIGNWVDDGGSVMVANKSNHGNNPLMLNPLMRDMGTTIRFNDDNVYEPEDSDKYTGGMVWSIVSYNLPYTQSGLNRNMEAVRIFSGSSLVAEDEDGNYIPLTNNEETNLEILLGGNETSYTANPGPSAHVYNEKGDLNGEDIPIIAKEEVGSGKVVAAGRHFYSDFEIGNDQSNTALTLEIIDWLADYDRYMTIEEVRQEAAEGDIVSVRGTVTAPTDHFFDVFYIQDETSGVNVYGTQAKNNLPVGTEVLVTGEVMYFEGELEIAFDEYNYQVLYVGPVDEVEPIELSTKEAMEDQYAGMLVTTKGKIVEHNQTESYFVVNDGSGDARIHVDGYVGADMGRFEEGDFVQVTGNASVGSEGARIRVRFYEDMELIDPFDIEDPEEPEEPDETHPSDRSRRPETPGERNNPEEPPRHGRPDHAGGPNKEERGNGRGRPDHAGGPNHRHEQQ